MGLGSGIDRETISKSAFSYNDFYNGDSEILYFCFIFDVNVSILKTFYQGVNSFLLRP